MLDRERTNKRNEDNLHRQIVGFGYGHSLPGKALIEKHIGPLVDFIAKVRAECPPKYKRVRKDP